MFADLSRADYALVVSIFAASVSVATLVWNVYSAAVLDQARIKVTVSTAIAAVASGTTNVVTVTAANLGKRPVRIGLLTVVIRPPGEPWWRRGTGRWKNGHHVVPPIAGPLPVYQSGVLEVGDEAHTLIDYDWLQTEATKLGATAIRGIANTPRGQRRSKTLELFSRRRENS